MPGSVPLLVRLVRQAADDLSDLLQVIVIQSHYLTKRLDSDDERVKRAWAIENAARKASAMSRMIFGLGEAETAVPPEELSEAQKALWKEGPSASSCEKVLDASGRGQGKRQA